MAAMTPIEAREILIYTRNRIKEMPETYNYENWADCACGQLYQTSMSKVASRGSVVHTPSPRTHYGRLMEALDPAIPTPVRAFEEANPAIRLSVWVRGGKAKRAVNRFDELIERFDIHYGPVAMNIGEEQPARTITPQQIPVPTEVPERESIPNRDPERAPERDPEQVPAR